MLAGKGSVLEGYKEILRRTEWRVMKKNEERDPLAEASRIRSVYQAEHQRGSRLLLGAGSKQKEPAQAGGGQGVGRRRPLCGCSQSTVLVVPFLQKAPPGGEASV